MTSSPTFIVLYLKVTHQEKKQSENQFSMLKHKCWHILIYLNPFIFHYFVYYLLVFFEHIARRWINMVTRELLIDVLF